MAFRTYSLAVAFGLVFGLAFADANDPPKKRDLTKRVLIERPSEELVKKTLGAKLDEKLAREVPKFVPKGRIERAPKKLVEASVPVPVPARVDRTKSDSIELPVKELVEANPNGAPLSVNNKPTRQANSPQRAPMSSANRHASSVKNPKVAAGKVNWHTDLSKACAASRESGKPVLLFHMMGNLDDQFC